MMNRILVAVNDSPAALAAARLAVGLAQHWQASLCAITVVADHVLTDRLRRELGDDGDGEDRDGDGLASRRSAAASAALRYVVGLADRAGVPVETVQVDGEPAARVLAQARAWRADLVVLGRSDRPGVGEPYVGGHTRHVLEFAEQPVLVVPSAPGPRPAPGARGGH